MRNLSSGRACAVCCEGRCGPERFHLIAAREHMRKKLLSGCSLLISVVAPAFAQAADPALPSFKGPSPAPIFTYPWEVQFGARYWYSSGNHQYDLYDPFATAIKNSRLTYGDLDAHSAEVYFRVDHQSGVFLKGYVGGGAIVGGKLNDEDFPPFTAPYSNTISSQGGGSLKYGSVDLGYNLFSGPTYKVGPFVGYHNFHERMNTFGCSQLAGNAGICGVQPPFGPIPTLYDGLDADVSWQSIRAGVAGEIVILPGLKVAGEAAWAHNYLQNTDYHNFRPDIRGLNQDGEGNGFQLEGVVSYDVTPNFNVGVGGRYWYFQANGKNHWEQTLSGVLFSTPSAPLQTTSERYGVFVQAGYKFGGAGSGDPRANPLAFGKVEPSPHNWNGLYIGANVGYGFGDSGVTQLSAASPVAAIFQGLAAIPTSQKADVGGFMGGGQVGYSYQISQRFVAGLEADITGGNIGGSFGNTDIFRGFTTSTTQNIDWLGTVRGRLGFLGRDDLMIYGTGGFAYGGVSAHGAVTSWVSRDCTPVFCSAGEASNTLTGWTAGAGLEYAIARNFNLKAEYLFVDLGKQNYTIYSYGGANAFNVPINVVASSDSRTHLIRTGLNYRFDWLIPGAPLAQAKY
jgi:opacity protein-like surface antigen